MAVHQRKIDPAGGPVEIEIFAGHKHVFSYRCLLMKGDGSDQVAVMEGTTIDNLPDKKTLVQTAAQLHGRFIAVDGLLSPIIVTGRKQPYQIDIHIRQGGSAVGGGPVVIKDELTTTIPILEHVEL
jgi:hypothetical protein